MKRKKLTLKEKKQFTNNLICYKCGKKLIKQHKSIIVCSNCELKINLSKY